MTLPAGLVVLSREGCGLCEQMLLDLAGHEQSGVIPPVTVLDVDSDPALARQYGLKVPVLLLDGSVICHYTLNSNELLRLIPRPAVILPR
jgi:hypothetical protein